MARTRTRFRGHQRRSALAVAPHGRVSREWGGVVAGLGPAGPRGTAAVPTRPRATVRRRSRSPAARVTPVALASSLGRQPVVLVFYMGDF